MPFTTLLPVHHGDIQGFPDAWSDQGLREFSGVAHKLMYGWAKLTGTLQNQIPLTIYSSRNQDVFPNKPLQIGATDSVLYVGIRLPFQRTTEQLIPGTLDTGVTMVGTTGENLKVSPLGSLGDATTPTVPAPIISCTNSAYPADGEAHIVRGVGSSGSDAASPSLLRTFSTTTPLQITVTNSGNTALGNGIRLSDPKATAYIFVVLCLRNDWECPRFVEFLQPIDSPT